MKTPYLIIICATIVIISALGVGLAMAVRENDKNTVAMSREIDTLRSQLAALASAKNNPAPIAEEKSVCRFIDDGYGFSAAKQWAFVSGGTEFDISSSLPKTLRDNEYMNGVWATHPSNYNLVYFSTTSNTPQTERVNRVYSFDLDKKNLKKLYEEKDLGGMILRLRGMDGMKLVIEKDAADNSPGPCAPIWSAGAGPRSYWSLDAANSSAGLMTYKISDCLYEIAEAESRNCTEAIEMTNPGNN
jgi:hypothetical protein